MAVAEDVDDPLCRGGSQRAGVGHLRHIQIDGAFHLGELGADHEEDQQQQHDVDHRHQVHRGLLIDVRFQRHGE
jgi:hypothetical protein